MSLIAPDGSINVLHSRSGSSTDNIVETYTRDLSVEVANGTWKLRVQDSASLDTGYLDSWTLSL
ncbi:proprotein convertase P-domain-containing protein [Solwaraspora sp. WMMA2059]|uniref:proprotein convertase P-domain-containing protein n=1 Tax=Solwaraspora sp. WMMA2059 TaxID=3015160 RepID=UPI0032B2EF60